MAVNQKLQVHKSGATKEENPLFSTHNLNGKTLQFYNQEGVKKEFEIHHYGEGGTLYFKKNVRIQKNKAS